MLIDLTRMYLQGLDCGLHDCGSGGGGGSDRQNGGGSGGVMMGSRASGNEV